MQDFLETGLNFAKANTFPKDRAFLNSPCFPTEKRCKKLRLH